jgi:hypothetical protein
VHLLSSTEIAPFAQALSAAVLSNVFSEFLANPACAAALRNYLALTAGVAGPELSAADRVYNRYFWFVRFKQLAAEQFGPNAGIDQQEFQILEQAECELDWNAIAELDSLAAHAP